MASGLYNGASGLALGTGLARDVSGLWSGASGLQTGFGASSMFPMDFTGTSLPSGVSLARASSKTYTSADGSTQVFGYNAAALGTNGILIEPAATNALKPTSNSKGNSYCSENFEDWSKASGTLALNSGTAPDGSNTMNLWTASASGAFASNISRTDAHVLTGDVTISIYVRKGNCQYIAFDHYGGTADYAAVFDLNAGTYVGTPYDATTSRSITALADGVFHIVMSYAAIVASTTRFLISTATGNNFVATSGDTVELWGLQIEAGLVATSYIPQKNYIFQSENINAAPHVTELLSFDLDATNAPDGQMTADKMSETAGLGNHEVYGVGVTTDNNKTYTLSGWVKGGERRYTYMAQSFGSPNSASIVIDTTAGTITQNSDYGSTTLVSYSLTAASNEFWLAILTFTDSGTGGGGYRYATTDTPTPDLSTYNSSHYDSTAVGDGAYWWGLQCVRGTAYSTYYYTGASNTARAADALSFTIPDGVSTLRYTFKDNSTQDVSVSPGVYTVPTNLTGPYIKTIDVV